MKLPLHIYCFSFTLFIFLCLNGEKSNAQFDSTLYSQVENLIYTNTFDSAEVILRNKLAEDVVSDETFFYAHLYLAKLYMKLGAKNKWNKEINFCKEISGKKSGSKYRVDLAFELSQDFFTLQQYDSAYFYSSLYVNYNPQINSVNYSKIQLINGYYYFINNAFEKAEACYLEAEKYFILDNLQCELPLVYTKLALLKGKQKLFTEADKYISKSMSSAESCNIILYKMISLQAKKDIFIWEDNYKEAYATLNEINTLNSTINDQNIKLQLTEIREKYGINEQERKLSLIEKDNTINKITLTYLYAVLGLMMLILILFFYFFQKNKRANKFIQLQTIQLTEQNKLIKDSLEQREFLYRELNHRIKNNLQLITSMLNLQDRYSHYKSYKDLIHEINQKINTIALTYAKMYMDGRKTNDIINLKEYISEIAHNVLQSISHDEIILNIHADLVSTNLDIAIPLGLITNEIITNSVKHAFTFQANPSITINLNQIEDYIHYSIEDNGSGIDQDFSLESANSLGSKIIYLLSRQIKSDLKIENQSGTKFIFTIYNLKKQHNESNNM
jgi:two-component sensor histidine kinase